MFKAVKCCWTLFWANCAKWLRILSWILNEGYCGWVIHMGTFIIQNSVHHFQFFCQQYWRYQHCNHRSMVQMLDLDFIHSRQQSLLQRDGMSVASLPSLLSSPSRLTTTLPLRYFLLPPCFCPILLGNLLCCQVKREWLLLYMQVNDFLWIHKFLKIRRGINSMSVF